MPPNCVKIDTIYIHSGIIKILKKIHRTLYIKNMYFLSIDKLQNFPFSFDSFLTVCIILFFLVG